MGLIFEWLNLCLRLSSGMYLTAVTCTAE
uniref:Uncharacterized protein n=1 Tax=Anguilla anguilla TaxID=7936 RepID=A0A0E9R6S4_ANGAN